MLWPESTATSQLDPARLPPASLFSPDPPVHPSADLAVIRLEGLSDGEAPPPGHGGIDEAVGTATSMLGASLLSLDDIEQATDPRPETMSRSPLSSMLAGGRDGAQTRYRRQTMVAGGLLLALFAVGAVTFPRSWRDPGPGIAVEARDDDGGPGSQPVDGGGAVVESDSAGGQGGNRGAMAGPGSSAPRRQARSTTTDEGDVEGELSTTTSAPAVETSATVGPSGPGSGCPAGLPIAGCPTTLPEPFGPTSSLVEATTSTTRVLVVSSSVPTTATTSTTRSTTTRPPRTTTTRPTTIPTTTTTTTTTPTTMTTTTTTTTPTTATSSSTTIETTTTTATTTGPTESQGSQPTFVVCHDPGPGGTPTTGCLPDP